MPECGKNAAVRNAEIVLTFLPAKPSTALKDMLVGPCRVMHISKEDLLA